MVDLDMARTTNSLPRGHAASTMIRSDAVAALR
jgi:hypothetical protein